MLFKYKQFKQPKQPKQAQTSPNNPNKPKPNNKMEYNMNQTLSLMIPRVFPQWINNKEIAKVFADQQIGKVYKVIIRHTKTEYKNGVKIPIYTARVYFHYWYNNKIAYNFQQQIIKKKQARIVYDDPWFWTIFENKRTKLSNNDERRMRVSRNMYRKRMHLHATIADIEMKIKDNLKKQNELMNKQMQKLQDFTIQSGLNVPFWSSTEPPLLSESIADLMNAQTAVNVAEFVLNNEDEEDAVDAEEENEEEILNNAYQTASHSAEQVLCDDDDDDDDNDDELSLSFYPQYMPFMMPSFIVVAQLPQLPPPIYYNPYMLHY